MTRTDDKPTPKTRTRDNLNAKQVAAIIKDARKDEPKRWADGGGLYLLRSKSGSVTWTFLYMRAGVRREVGLGRASDVTLARARALAHDYRDVLAGGGDPLTSKREAAMTFKEAADASRATHVWKNEAKAKEWDRMVDLYCKSLHSTPVKQISVEHVLRVIIPLIEPKPTMAKLVRSVMRRVLAWAAVNGQRDPNLVNPADAAKGQKIAHKTTNFRTMPYAGVPAYVRSLRDKSAISARALEFLILTWVRKNEAVGARWGEIDLSNATWTIPAERMKAGREHVVPLSPRAVELLTAVQPNPKPKPTDFVFSSPDDPRRSLSTTSAFYHLKAPSSIHGFRSAARDWAGDCTYHDWDVAEAALAHTTKGVAGSYRRGNAFLKRRALMNDWAVFLDSTTPPTPHDAP